MPHQRGPPHTLRTTAIMNENTVFRQSFSEMGDWSVTHTLPKQGLALKRLDLDFMLRKER